MEDKKESKSDKKRLLVLTLCAPQANAVAFSIQKWLIEQLPLFMTDKGPQIYTSRPRIPSIKDLIVS